MAEIDYAHCWICGALMGPDRMHVLIDNGRVTRHVYCCRKHRYVQVAITRKVFVTLPNGHRPAGPTDVTEYVTQERTDLELESLSFAFRCGDLEPGWE